jgi:Divergent CRAL/TRIO domain
MHSKVQSGDNNPGLLILRWIYEELPSNAKDRLKVVYFLHPGIRSRLAMATLGRWFLSGGSDHFFLLFIFIFFYLTGNI